MNELKVLFEKRFPGQRSDLKFRDISMDSLSWSSFLSEASQDFTREKQELFLRKLFLEHTFEELDLVSLSEIMKEVRES